MRVRIQTPRRAKGTGTAPSDGVVPRVFHESLNVSLSYGSSIGSANFTIDDSENGNTQVTHGMDVWVEKDDGTVVFGGVITSITYRPIGAKGRHIMVTASDWTILADMKSVLFLQQVAGEKGVDIIRKAFSEAGLSDSYGDGGEGINVNSYVLDDVAVPQLAFTGSRVSEILNQIAGVSSYVWWIDGNKALHYTPVGLSERGLSFSG